MNMATIIILLIVIVAAINGIRYSLKHGSCEACSGVSCGVGGKCSGHCKVDESKIPDRFKLKK